jgi:hypothetical protein
MGSADLTYCFKELCRESRKYQGPIEQLPTRYDLFQYDGGLHERYWLNGSGNCYRWLVHGPCRL